MYEAGVENCVGLFGKDISHYQKDKLLKTGVTTLIVLTDNDQAGREAKIKIKRDLSRLFTLKFPKMSKKDIKINRKILSEIAIDDPSTFKKVVEVSMN